MMDNTTLARNFKALAHPRRAHLFRLLADNPSAGVGFERLAQTVGIAESSLAHHLREMERCGVIIRRRQGVTVTIVLTPTEFTTALAVAMRTSETARTRRARAA